MKKLLLNILPFVVIIAGLFLIYISLLSSKGRSKQTNALIRVTACIISKNAKSRAQSDIEKCYQVVQQDTGVTLPRYDK